MSRDPLFNRKTALAYKTKEKTVLRGYNLSDLAEEGYSFSDAMFVLFQGRIPTEAEEKMLTYEMGSFLEHSMSPSAGSAIAVTAGRPNLPTAVAAGVMTFGGVHGPGAAHGYMMNKYLKKGQKEGKSVDEIAKELVDDYMDAGMPVMGMGQPQHRARRPAGRADSPQAGGARHQRRLPRAAAQHREALPRPAQEGRQVLRGRERGGRGQCGALRSRVRPQRRLVHRQRLAGL